MAASSHRYDNRGSIDKHVQYSKTMSYLLRHGAVKEGLRMTSDGFIRMDDLLEYKTLRGATMEDLVAIVENCSKKRFSIKTVKDEVTQADILYVRANQGHSIDDLQVDMKEISENDDIEECLHGTYYKAWDLIKNEVDIE